MASLRNTLHLHLPHLHSPVSDKYSAEALHLLWIVFGIFIYSLGFVAFLLPHHIVIGGMAGFGTLVYFATGGLIPVAATMYGTNLLLLAAAYRKLGRAFVIRTIFGTTTMSGIIGLMESYFTSHPPIIADASMSMVLGAVMLGVGIGVYMRHKGTAGGTDIIAAVLSQTSNISVGRVMMIVDISIVTGSFFLPFDGTLEARVQSRVGSIIYGFLSIYIYSYVADRVIYAGRQTVQILILSDQWHTIADRITHETGRGVTTWESKGFWTGTPRTMMIVWCRKEQLAVMHSIIYQVDPGAYVTTSPVNNLYGNGFDVLKPKK